MPAIDLKNRGRNDIFVACIDGLSGFAEAVHAAYPQPITQIAPEDSDLAEARNLPSFS